MSSAKGTKSFINKYIGNPTIDTDKADENTVKQTIKKQNTLLSKTNLKFIPQKHSESVNLNEQNLRYPNIKSTTNKIVNDSYENNQIVKENNSSSSLKNKKIVNDDSLIQNNSNKEDENSNRFNRKALKNKKKLKLFCCF